MVGFIRGILWGGVVAVGGLVAISQLVPPSPTGAVSEKPSIPEPAANVSAPPVAEPEPDAATVSPATSAPRADGAAPSVVGDEPEVMAVEEPAAPAVLPTEPAEAPSATGEGPASPPEVLASAPEAQNDLPTERTPAAPLVTENPGPAPLDKPNLGEPAASDTALDPPNAPQEAPAAPPSDAPSGAMAEPLPADQPQAKVASAPAQAPATTAPEGPIVPTQDSVPDAIELPPPPPLNPEEEALLQPSPAEEAPRESVAVEPAEPPSSVLQPTPGLTDEAEGVITGRLPRIGEEDAPATTEAEAQEEAITPTDDESLPPIQRFARAFENPDQKPLFAILLQDTGEDVDRAALATLDLPLTVVIDPLAEGAADRAAIWRSGGQEVVLSAESVPEGATPGDLEQIFQALVSRLPESVAVIDVTGGVFQNNRPLAAQIVPILSDQGRGLVTFDQGLNAADQVARREGLASVTIFRRFDPDGAEAPAVKRYLDRAVFKAAQEGQVAVIGTLTPETVAGLLEWSIEGRASTVAAAPVSALLLRDR